MIWKTSRREILLDRPLVMGILNVTPDSFYDRSRYPNLNAALGRVEMMIDEGADIIDVGGESTRPGSESVKHSVEMDRTVSIVDAIAKRFDVPISIDTTKHLVAQANIDHGAEIINDISGLRWDPEIAKVAAHTGAGLVLMHSRGEFATMHSRPPVEDVFQEVISGLTKSVELAKFWSVKDEQIVLDVGIGFGKTVDQNLDLIDNLDTIIGACGNYRMLIGTSRKSFLRRTPDDAPASDRLQGSLKTALRAAKRGASILRVHDVKEMVSALLASTDF